MESVNCQTEENRPEDIKFPQIIRKTTFATLQTTNMLMNNSFFSRKYQNHVKWTPLQCWSM